MPGTHTGQKRVSNPLALELSELVSSFMGTGVEPGTQQLLYTTEPSFQSPMKLFKNKTKQNLGKIGDYFSVLQLTYIKHRLSF